MMPSALPAPRSRSAQPKSALQIRHAGYQPWLMESGRAPRRDVAGAASGAAVQGVASNWRVIAAHFDRWNRGAKSYQFGPAARSARRPAAFFGATAAADLIQEIPC